MIDVDSEQIKPSMSTILRSLPRKTPGRSAKTFAQPVDDGNVLERMEPCFETYDT